MTDERDTTRSEDQQSKKKYDHPSLTVYGNIREITRSVGNMGATDGGSVGGFKKTAL